MSWIYPIVLILLIVAVMVFGRKSPVKGGDKLRKPMSFDDKENLRHTIKVNLSILDNELGELNAEIEAFSDFPEKDKLVPPPCQRATGGGRRHAGPGSYLGR